MRNGAQSPPLRDRNLFRYWEQLKERGRLNKDLLFWTNHFFFQLYNIAVMRYKWIGFPEDVNYFKLEDYLLTHGKCIFIHDNAVKKEVGKTSGFAIMKCHDYGNYDIYNIPEDSYAYANTGYNKKYSQDDSVLIFDKPISYPSILDIRLYAETLAKTVMTRNQNKYLQRSPVAVYGSRDDMTQWENALKDYDDFVAFIKMDSTSLDGDISKRMGVLNANVPYLGNDLSGALRQEKAEALGSLGIECQMLEKSERQTQQESAGQDGFIESVRNVNSGTRDDGAKKITNMFGEEIQKMGGDSVIKVEFNSQLPTAVNGFMADVGMQYSGMRQSRENIIVDKEEGEED